MNQKAEEINENTAWQDLTVGAAVYEPMTAARINTGDWRTRIPVFIEEKCRHCLICAPFCPDSSIPVEEERRLGFDLMHCKGCGICYKVCPFGAIDIEKV